MLRRFVPRNDEERVSVARTARSEIRIRHQIRSRITRSLSSGAHSRDPLAPSGYASTRPRGANATPPPCNATRIRGATSRPHQGFVNAPLQKYFYSGLTQIKSISLTVSSQAGAYRDRHGRGAGCGGRGSVRRCQGMAGRVDMARELTNGTLTTALSPSKPLAEMGARGRRSRVVLTPQGWRQVCGGKSARPGSDNALIRNDGDNKAWSPGRARRKPLKPLRAGMPGESGGPVVTMLVCYFTFRTRGRGCIGRPAFPTPSHVEAKDACTTRAHRAARSRTRTFLGCLKIESETCIIRAAHARRLCAERVLLLA